jgi:LysR family glycine cleavage system transcriptional activator
MRPPPALNHLWSFRVIGKHLNLARAAPELHLSVSALSHQLNQLEKQLGVKLFVRTGRGLSFTQAGQELYREADTSLGRLSGVIQDITRSRAEDVLVVNAPPTLAQRWLLPRLSRFKDYARAEIRISTLPIDFARDHIDCEIHYGQEAPAGLHADLLWEEELVVACTPSLITQQAPLSRPAHLSRHQLLHARIRPGAKFNQDAWLAWSQSMQEPIPGILDGLVLESRNLLIQAAESGLGVAVVDPMMIKTELRSGRLMQPLPHVGRSGCSYRLVYPHAPEPSPKLQAFRLWLIREMREDAA